MPGNFNQGAAKIETGSAAGPNPYDDSSPPSIAIPNLVQIDEVMSVEISASGYVVQEDSVTDNSVTYRVYENRGDTNTDPLTQVTDSDDLSTHTVSVTAKGF